MKKIKAKSLPSIAKGFGPTADPNNAGIPPHVFAGFAEAMDTRIVWRAPDVSERAAFRARADMKDIADSLYACAEGWKSGAWVVRNDWHGFPDPAEFHFFGFDAQGQVNAMGYFEDWPSYWPFND